MNKWNNNKSWNYSNTNRNTRISQKRTVPLVKIIFYSILAASLIFAVYFRSNSKSIYSSLGNFYLKKNPSKAQEYYEKSMALGNNSTKFRESYVNLLINSPLTIEAQERLVKIAEDKKKDSASLNAEYFLYNLKREIHNKYPESYIKQAPYNNKIMHWGKMPITYCIKNTHGVPQEFVEEINNAFDEWERVSSGRIKFQRVHGSADIEVQFMMMKPGKVEYNTKYVVAYTTPNLTSDSLHSMDLKISINDAEGKLFSRNQLYNTALHEIFHALGFMGHSYEKESIMYMSKDKETILNDTRIPLTDADKSTLELLYRIKPDITNAHEIKYDYVPYLILGADKEVNYTKINEARNYIKKAPSLPNGYIDLAQSLVNKKEYGLAIRNLDKALNLAQDKETRYIIYYNLAVSYFYITNYQLTHAYIEQAKNIHDSEELHYLEAETFLKEEKTKEALKSFKYLNKIAPKNPYYVTNIANIYIKNHNYMKARKILKDYIKQNPTQKSSPDFSSYGILLW